MISQCLAHIGEHHPVDEPFAADRGKECLVLDRDAVGVEGPASEAG